MLGVRTLNLQNDEDDEGIDMEDIRKHKEPEEEQWIRQNDNWI